MNPQSIQIMVLDAHGVIFNNPFTGFLGDVADMTGQYPEEVLERWYRDIRMPAWTGAISDEEIWHSLTGHRGDPECWQALLETHYALGPVGHMLKMWSQMMPLWILSNHRSHWLHRRLRRFGIGHLFDRVIVSEEMRLTKPDHRLFEYVLNELPRSATALYIDDQSRNVEAATDAGFLAVKVDDYIASFPRQTSFAHG